MSLSSVYGSVNGDGGEIEPERDFGERSQDDLGIIISELRGILLLSKIMVKLYKNPNSLIV